MADVKSSGGWVEVAAPGINIALRRATMPHALVSEANGTFTFKRLDWANREVGDDVTAPVPSFVGSRINDVFFTRNRLGFLTAENVVMSRAGGQFFNFFRETATQVLDTDPIDLSATEKDLSVLTSAVPFNDDILIFSPKAQFRFTSGQESFTPKTVQMKPASKYDNTANCTPVSAGSSVFFAVDRQTSTGVMEYVVDAVTATSAANEITEHVPRYLPKGIWKMVVSTSERMLLALTREDPTAIYAYSFYSRGQERLQSSWSRWTFEPGSSILDISIFGTEAILLIQRADGVHMEAMRLPSGRNDGVTDHVVHLDRRITENQVVMAYDVAAGITVVLLPYNHGNLQGGQLQVWERFDTPVADRNPRRIHHSRATNVQILLPGDARNRKFFIGIAYDSAYEFSEQFLRQENAARTDGRLQLRRMSASHARTGGYVVEVRNSDRDLIDNVDLQAFGWSLWDSLKRFETSAIRAEGVTLYLDAIPGFSDTGPLSGRWDGVLPDGRFYAQITGSGSGQRFTTDIGANGAFSFSAMPTGVKAVQLVRARDQAVVHQHVFGQEGSGGHLLVAPDGMFLVSPDAGLSVDAASGGGALLRAYDPRLDEDVVMAAEYANRFITAAQAKAVLAAVTWNMPDYAARWLRPVLATQASDGRFPGEISPLTLAGNGAYPMSAQTWMALALATFAKQYPAHALAASAKTALTKLLGYLDSRIGTGVLAGLIRLENGSVASGDNMVAYFAYKAAASALADTAWNTKAVNMGAGIERVFWIAEEGRYASTADASGNRSTDKSANWLAPLFAAQYGSLGRGLLAREWFDYFETADGSARGYAPSANSLTTMGDYAYGVGGLASEATFQAVISKLSLGDRAGARLDMARMTPLAGELGVRNSVIDGEVHPWWDLRATAMGIIALLPAVVFGVTSQPPLWNEGVQAVTRNPPFRYTFVADKPTDEGHFGWPIGTRSENAKVTIRSLGALPFAILSARWEGYFTSRAQKV